MARPKVAEKRDHKLSVALTEREFALLKKRADVAGARLVDYVRAAMLRRRIAVEKAVAAVPGADRQMVEAIRRMGVNLNQACRQLNSFGHAPPPDLEPLLREVRAILAKATADDR